MTAMMKKYEEPLRQVIRPRKMILKIETIKGVFFVIASKVTPNTCELCTGCTVARIAMI